MRDQRFANLPIPLSPDRWAWLAAVWPLSAREWNQLMATLGAMRPGLVSDAIDEMAEPDTTRDESALYELGS